MEAIVSGTNPGLTVIVGPPGTGKTDVATQIISNLYHNFPQQRTLLIAHSNQALNQLFQKITALEIDERHLLRLGHGEEDLKSDNNYSKQGRVESFMDNRARLLAEVDRLAVCLGAPGAHGDSCETADYFNMVYGKPTWAKFEEFLGSGTKSVQEIKAAYPFNYYFSNAPGEMFLDSMSPDDALEVAMGGYRHIKKIFSELEDIRPFELLRTARDRQNYLLTKEARLVAMTSTHAAMRVTPPCLHACSNWFFETNEQTNSVTILQNLASRTKISSWKKPLKLQKSRPSYPSPSKTPPPLVSSPYSESSFLVTTTKTPPLSKILPYANTPTSNNPSSLALFVSASPLSPWTNKAVPVPPSHNSTPGVTRVSETFPCSSNNPSTEPPMRDSDTNSNSWMCQTLGARVKSIRNRTSFRIWERRSMQLRCISI